MRSQSGVVGLAQLRALGVTKAEVAGMVTRRELWRVRRGVYADARSPMTPRGHLFAAALSFAPEAQAFFSHRTAAALLGLRDLSVGRLDLTVVADHTPNRPPLRIHRSRREPPGEELRAQDGLTYSSAMRMLVELAPCEKPEELSRLITAAARKRLLEPRSVERMLARHARAPGIGNLRSALAAYRPTPADKSGFERDFAEWLTTDPRIPPPQRNVYLDGWELDFYWPDYRVVAETDGERYHMLPADRERDYRKDAWLQRQRSRSSASASSVSSTIATASARTCSACWGWSPPDPAHSTARRRAARVALRDRRGGAARTC